MGAIFLLTFLMASARFFFDAPAPVKILDDAMMFTRYAEHLVGGRGIVWNLGEQQVYGCSSLAYLALVAIGTALGFHGLPLLAALSFGFGIGSLFVLSLIFRRATRVCHGQAAACTGMLLAPGLVLSASLVSVPLNGMESTLSTAAIAVWLLAITAEHRSVYWYSILGLSGGLMFWVRPELPALTACVLFVLGLFEKRREPVIGGMVGIMTVLVLLQINQMMFDSPVPLSAYLKLGAGYGDFNYDEYERYRLAYLLRFALAAVGPCLVLLVVSVKERGALLQRLSGLSLALSFATVLFICYQFFMVTPIMGHGGRFYWPIFPFLFYLSATAARPYIEYTSLLRVGSVVVACIFVGNVPAVVLDLANGHLYRMDWSYLQVYRVFRQATWFALDEISALPDDLRFASADVGLPGVMNPNKAFLDLAGLNDTAIAKHPAAIGTRLIEFAPDFVYLPHINYVTLNRSIRENPQFAERYSLYPTSKLGYVTDVAIRKDSPFYARLRAIVRRRTHGMLGEK